MHARNPYQTRLDFRALAEYYPALEPFVSSDRHVIDFRNSVAQRTLTQALLKRDFGLNLHLPHDRLCPPVPNRLNYVLWIQDITSMSRGQVRGLDIGTGASAIYPLLACRLPGNSTWSFVATEIDPQSVQYASRNIQDNDLASRITLLPTLADSEFILAPLFNDPQLSFDFTMCNPPFYGSLDEIETSADNKEFAPNAVCTGAENEMITPGGEIAFVLKMLRESCHENIRLRCRWFTSMLGKLSSVEVIISELRSLKIDNYALTQFVQGTTRRWAVAWSFGDERLPDKFCRPTAPSLLPFLPLPTTLLQRIALDSFQTRELLSHILNSIEKLSYTFMEGDAPTAAGESGTTTPGKSNTERDESHNVEWACTISALENTWSRAARRSRKRAHEVRIYDSVIQESTYDRERKPSLCDTRVDANPCTPSSTAAESPGISFKKEPLPILICRISAESGSESIQHRRKAGNGTSVAADSVVLTAQWLRGSDRSTFEGFWSHVCRKLKTENV